MKRVLIFFIFFIFILGALASVEVNDYSFEDSYVPGDNIVGEIDLTVKDEKINSELTSNQNDKIVFRDFLDLNNAEYSCSPSDCSTSYKVLSGSEDESFSKNFEDVYAGFVIKGNNVEVTGLYFSIKSDFYSSIENPLNINFFEENLWEYDEFSEGDFTPKNWGCFDNGKAVIGPLIRTANYCELIHLSKTNSIFAGALVDKADNKNLKMSVYTEYGYFIKDCSFNPLTEEGCNIKTDEGDVFSEGNYQICVGAVQPTDYHVYEEGGGVNCGFVYSVSLESSVKDYGVFARTAKYADSNSFSSQDINFGDYIASANNLINQKYGGNCSAGCVFPLVISGIPQNVRIYNITLDYLKDKEDYVEKRIYKIEPVPALVNFDGVLNLSLAEFKANSKGDYKIYLGNITLFEEEIEFLPAPVIKSFFPLSPPAGVPVNFYLNIEFNGSRESLDYKWDFGDEKIFRTTTNSIVYTFPEIKDYPISVEVSSGVNLTSKRDFLVKVISPRDALNFSIAQRKKSLGYIISYIDDISAWYSEDLKRELNISFYEETLERLESERENATNDSDFLEIAREIYSLDFFDNVYTESGTSSFFVTQVSDVKPESVAIMSGETSPSNSESYRESIITWQRENVNLTSMYKKIVFFRESGREDVFRYYIINLKSNSDEESFFIINIPIENVFFRDNSVVKSAGDSSGITLSAGERKVVEFYYFGPEEISFFVSPRLSSILLEEDINKTCNFNLVCEPNLDEDWRNCRSDCKPRSRALIYFIIGFLILFVVYTLLQLWYKKHYENYLFGRERSQIYNLLMYVANARARGMKDGAIVSSLKEKEWNSEKIRYIIKKSYGKNVGMIEIIPFSRISAFFRNREAKKNLNAQNSVPPRGFNFNPGYR